MPHLHISQDIRVGNENDLIAVSTKLGWVLMGGKNCSKTITSNLFRKESESVSEIVEHFWEIESYGTHKKMIFPTTKIRATCTSYT